MSRRWGPPGIPPEPVLIRSGPAMPSARTSPESASTSAAATPVTVMSPLSLSSVTFAVAGTSRR
ncbi:hypothetical protein [Streptomyces yangpuensis]|uniref:hypothetical protein n=1 Tax=Streptomyces yangpuensis TaxID=1648182 RepID=UPI00343E0CA6